MKNRKRKVIVKIILIALVAVSLFLILGSAKEVIQMMQLKKREKIVSEELARIQQENTELLKQKEKLADPNYVQTYARGNYMFSKQGEQVFYLPSSKNPSKKEVEKQDEGKSETKPAADANVDGKQKADEKPAENPAPTTENKQN